MNFLLGVAIVDVPQPLGLNPGTKTFGVAISIDEFL
jgi:hypothetical protein